MKSNYKVRVGLVILLFVNPSGIYAQKLHVNGNFLLGLPQGEFNKNVKNTGYGFGGYFVYPLGKTPLMAGLDLGFIHYGEDIPEALKNDSLSINARVEPIDNLLTIHALLRIQGRTWPIRPYAELLGGLHHFFSETKRTEPFPPADPVSISTNKTAGTFSFGLSGGFLTRLYDTHEENEEEGRTKVILKEILLDFRIRYLFGGNVEFLVVESVQNQNQETSIRLIKANSNILTLQFGVVFTFL